MGLRQKLDEDELALLEIVTDPVWLGEFLRNTSDGEVDKNTWPPMTWSYRDYQKQFLTDKTEFILYTGGRAIGKCQPSGSRVYTSEGYQRISDLVKLPYFVAYCVDPISKQIIQRRAVITKDKQASAYTITTASSHSIVATDMHPILTPTGYKLVADIEEGDYIAVTTKLPSESHTNALQWHELRLLGYIYFKKSFRPTNWITPKYKKIGAEIEVIADRLSANWYKDFDGKYKILQLKGPFVHPIKSLLKQTSLYNAISMYNGVRNISKAIMSERLENVQIFLEALFAQFADISTKEITLKTPHKQICMDLQELLLRFGIESKWDSDYTLSLLDYRAVYKFLTMFDIPGITVGTLPAPSQSNDANENMRYDLVTSKHKSHDITDTYAVHVYEHNNYISDNVYVHNSVVLEDKMVYDIVNSQDEFPVTPELVLTTANQAQMTPLQNRLILRFTSGMFLKDFLRNNINKSTGVMTFPRKGKPFIMTMRIAGSKGENNMIFTKLVMYKEINNGEHPTM